MVITYGIILVALLILAGTTILLFLHYGKSSQCTQDTDCNNGKCTDGSCVCEAGYTVSSKCKDKFLNCTTTVDCNNGTCSTDGSCVCDAGYSQDSNCKDKIFKCRTTADCNNGKCTGGICVCDATYSKDSDCKDSVSCNGNGKYDQDKCICNTGYTPDDMCKTFKCTQDTECNNGKCTDGACVCNAGYSQDSNCKDKDIRHNCDGGTCVANPDGYYDSKDKCEQACAEGINKYKCTQSGCQVDANGIYTTRDACLRGCDYEKYTCAGDEKSGWCYPLAAVPNSNKIDKNKIYDNKTACLDKCKYNLVQEMKGDGSSSSSCFDILDSKRCTDIDPAMPPYDVMGNKQVFTFTNSRRQDCLGKIWVCPPNVICPISNCVGCTSSSANTRICG